MVRTPVPRSFESGFTLLEVLVILAILSLIAGIAFPTVEKAMRRQSFVEAAARFEASLHAARAEAIRGDARVRFAVSADRRDFGFRGSVDRLPDGLVADASQGAIDFYGDGSATGGIASITGSKLQRRWQVRAATGTIEPMP